MKNFVRLSVTFLLVLTTAACSIDAELFAGSLQNVDDPDDGNGGSQKTAYANGVYGVQVDINTLESFVMKRNTQGHYDRLEKTDALAFFGIQVVGRSLLATTINLQTSKYSIYRLTGLEQVEIVSNVFEPSYSLNFVHNDNFYVQKEDFSLVSIDAQGNVATVCTNCEISKFRKLSGNFAFIESNVDTTFYMGPPSSLTPVNMPASWKSTGSDQSLLVGTVAYVSAQEGISSNFGIVKFENGTPTVWPTSNYVLSLGNIGTTIYASINDSGRSALVRFDSNGLETTIADLGISSSNAKIVGQNSSGLFVVKEDVSPNYELFFYDGVFTKISNFQHGSDINPVLDVRMINNGIVYSDYNGQPYFSTKTVHSALSNYSGCYNSSYALYMFDNVLHTSNASVRTCRLNGFTFETVLTESLGPLVEIK